VGSSLRRAVGILTPVTGFQAEAIFPSHVVRMLLDLSGLPDRPVHVSGYGRYNAGVLELDVMAQPDAVFGHG
jgi:hypothetical protein